RLRGGRPTRAPRACVASPRLPPPFSTEIDRQQAIAPPRMSRRRTERLSVRPAHDHPISEQSEKNLKRTDYCGRIDRKYLGQRVTVCGWVHRRRDHGGVIFVDLRDREGLVQIVCDPDRAATFAVAEEVRNEFCLKVTGLVRARPAGTDNPNLTSGKVEVLCHELEVLNPSVTPPF